MIDFGVRDAYSVGRRVTNDISISDISVSRQQAILALMGDQVICIDGDSKFGTFVKMDGLCNISKFECPIVPI